MAYEQHQAEAADIVARAAIITLSDTRSLDDDKSGAAIESLMIKAGHRVVSRVVIPDEPVVLKERLTPLLRSAEVDLILTTGGTGISRRDQTIDTLAATIDKPLPGFGELFRMLSWDQIGSGAMLSRATGGIAGDKLLFAMPGSTKAVELAMTRLIVPELKHLLRELRK